MEDQTQILDTSLGRRINWLRVLADLLIITTLLCVIAIIIMLWRINNLPNQTSSVSTTTPVANGSITSAKLAAGSVGLDQLSPDIASYLQSALQNPGGTTNIVGACTYFVVCNTPIVEQANIAIQSVSPYFVGAQIRGANGQVNDILQVQNSSGYPLVNVNANGQVGINYPIPQTTLAVNGTAQFTGHTATGNASAIDNPSIITPLTGTPIVRVQGTQEMITSLTPGYNFYSGSSSEYFVNLNQSANSHYFTGGYHAGEVVSGNPNSFAALAGDAGLAIHEGTGNIGLMAGLLGYAFNNSSGTINGAAGTYGYLTNKDNGTINTGQAVGGIVENTGSGTINIANGLSVNVYNGSFAGPAFSGSGNIGNANGVSAGVTNNSSGTIDNVSVVDIQRVVNNGTGSIADVHGLYIADQSGVGTGVNFNIYSRGVTSENAFDGKVAIGSYGALPTFGTDSRLMVNHNPAFGFQTTDNDAIMQVNGGLSATALVVQGTAFSTSDLQQWQGFNGAVVSRVTSNGSLGVGRSATPSYLLHVGSASTVSGTTVARFENAGGTCDITPNVAGGVTCTSDIRLKKDISELTSGLAAIGAINIVQYHYNAEDSTTGLHTGVIAQELEKILPDLVVTDKDGIKSVSYAGLAPYLVKAVQEQNGKLDDVNKQLGEQGIQLSNISDELKAVAGRVDTLEGQVKDLQTEVQDLKQKLNSPQVNGDTSTTTPTSSP